MKDTHIIELLDSMPLAEVDATQREYMRVHAGGCASCQRALEAAELVSLTMHARAAIVVEPSPFFQTRVLAALREQQASNVPALLRFWRNAGKLVSSMAVTTAALAALSFFVVPASTPADQTATAYSAEAVLFDQGGDDLSYEQVLSTIYSEEDEAK
jgi:hypothetical protein